MYKQCSTVSIVLLSPKAKEKKRKRKEKDEIIRMDPSTHIMHVILLMEKLYNTQVDHVIYSSFQ